MTILWLKCLLWINQPGKLSLPSLITWITRVETIKRQTGLRTAVWLQVKVRQRGLSLQPIGCTPDLSLDTKAWLQLWYAACGAVSVLCVFAFFTLLFIPMSGTLFVLTALRPIARHVTSAPLLRVFCSRLKTHLFSGSFRGIRCACEVAFASENLT